MTLEELHTLITGLSVDHPARVAYEAQEWQTCADLLNAKTLRGYITIRELSAYCVTRGITGGVLALDTIPVGTDIAPETPMTMEIKGMLKTVITLIQDDYRLEEVDTDDAAFDQVTGGLQSLGLMTAEQTAELKAMGDNRASLVGTESVSAQTVRSAWRSAQ
jgi:hypothetical protein